MNAISRFRIGTFILLLSDGLHGLDQRLLESQLGLWRGPLLQHFYRLPLGPWKAEGSLHICLKHAGMDVTLPTHGGGIPQSLCDFLHGRNNVFLSMSLRGEWFAFT